MYNNAPKSHNILSTRIISIIKANFEFDALLCEFTEVIYIPDAIIYRHIYSKIHHHNDFYLLYGKIY